MHKLFFFYTEKTQARGLVEADIILMFKGHLDRHVNIQVMVYGSCAGKWVSWSAQTLWSKGPVFVPYCSTYYFIVVPPFYCCNARSQYQSQIMKLYCTDTAHFLHTVTPSNCIVCWGYSICRERCVDVKVNFQLHFCSFIWTSLCHNCSVTRFSPCRKLFAIETLHCFHQI